MISIYNLKIIKMLKQGKLVLKAKKAISQKTKKAIAEKILHQQFREKKKLACHRKEKLTFETQNRCLKACKEERELLVESRRE